MFSKTLFNLNIYVSMINGWMKCHIDLITCALVGRVNVKNIKVNASAL